MNPPDPLPTPLTDAATIRHGHKFRLPALQEVYADFARTLERRNAELLRVAQGLRGKVIEVMDMLKGNDPARAPSMWVAEEMLEAALAEFDKLNATKATASD